MVLTGVLLYTDQMTKITIFSLNYTVDLLVLRGEFVVKNNGGYFRQLLFSLSSLLYNRRL